MWAASGVGERGREHEGGCKDTKNGVGGDPVRLAWQPGYGWGMMAVRQGHERRNRC